MKTYLLLIFACGLMVACAGVSGAGLRAATERAFAHLVRP